MGLSEWWVLEQIMDRMTPGGGGALRYWMTTDCRTAMQSGGGERQNLGAVNSFEGKKRVAVNMKLRTW